MNLQTLQINLLNLVKSRTGVDQLDDSYLRKVAVSPNLVLIKKIIHWWRSLQINNYCVLTVTLLKSYRLFDDYISAFIKEPFSIFREEVGLEFIDFMNEGNINLPALVQSVSKFEKALIKLKTDNSVEEHILWSYEPLSVIQALLDNTFDETILKPGKYETEVSSKFGNDLFSVYQLDGDNQAAGQSSMVHKKSQS